MRWVGAVTLPGSKNLCNGAYAHRGADVDMPDDGGASHVIPVRIVGGKFLRTRSLDNICPFWQTEFASPETTLTVTKFILQW